MMYRARFATSAFDVIDKLNLNLRDIEAELARRPQAGPAATKPQSLPIPSPSAVRHDATAGIDEGDIKHMTAAWVSGLTGGGSTALHSHSQYMLAAMRGAVNGVCELDANSLIPIGRVPASLLGGVRYQGVWNATTNTPTLATSPDSTTKGFYYKVSVAGTWNSISWAIGDWIISSGTSWDKVDNTDQVTSVFGRQGAITAQSGDYTPAQVGAEPAVTAGTVSQFWSGLKKWRDLAADVRAVVLTGLSTATNSAITATDSILVSLGKLQAQINARPAISVVDAVADGSMSAVTSNAVFDALAGKAAQPTLYTNRLAGDSNNSVKICEWAISKTAYVGGAFTLRIYQYDIWGSFGYCDVMFRYNVIGGESSGSWLFEYVGGSTSMIPRIRMRYTADASNWYFAINCHSTNPRILSQLLSEFNSDGTHIVTMGFRDIADSGGTTALTLAATPAAGDDSIQTATTAWVRGRLADTTVGNADKVDGYHIVYTTYAGKGSASDTFYFTAG